MCICLIISIRGLPFKAHWQQYTCIPPALTVTTSEFFPHSVFIFVTTIQTNGDYFLKQN